MASKHFCDKCDISVDNNYLPHWGQGNKDADIMIITDLPTRSEKRKGRVYLGNKYDYINRLLELNNFNKSNAYFTYLIKCNTPRSRNPSEFEVKNCMEHLITELSINPTFIVLLGSNVMKHFFSNPYISVYKEHGIPRLVGNKIIIPTFSAAFLNLNPSMIVKAYFDWVTITQLYQIKHPNHQTLF